MVYKLQNLYFCWLILKHFNVLKMVQFIFTFFLCFQHISTSARLYIEILAKTKVIIPEINNLISFFLQIHLKLLQQSLGSRFYPLIWG